VRGSENFPASAGMRKEARRRIWKKIIVAAKWIEIKFR
jgi:hypothetical protein